MKGDEGEGKRSGEPERQMGERESGRERERERERKEGDREIDCCCCRSISQKSLLLARLNYVQID